MANKTIKFREINRDIFQAIVDGTKKFETRAAIPEYLSVQIGEKITLVCGKDRVEKEIKSVEHFKTIGALLQKYKPEAINPNIHSDKDARKMWYSFPGYKEKIKNYGLIVWQLK